MRILIIGGQGAINSFVLAAAILAFTIVACNNNTSPGSSASHSWWMNTGGSPG